MLEAQGILDTSPYRGARVAEFSETRIDQICAARVALERLAIHDAIIVYRADPARIGRLDAIIARMEHAAERLNWAAVSKADLDFHREICAASGNGVVTTLWETLARHVMIVFGREIRDERDAARLGSARSIAACATCCSVRRLANSTRRSSATSCGRVAMAPRPSGTDRG